MRSAVFLACAVLLASPSDAQTVIPDDTLCRGAWDNDEASNPGCGLGAELALLLAVVVRWRRPRA